MCVQTVFMKVKKGNPGLHWPWACRWGRRFEWERVCETWMV